VTAHAVGTGPRPDTTRAEICPRCEEGFLVSVVGPHDVVVEGSTVRIPEVRVDECRTCGYRSLSGREAGLIEVLFASRYDRITDLVRELRAAGYQRLFLTEERTPQGLCFGQSTSVESLNGALRELYLDNETGHILHGLQGASGIVPVDVAGRLFRLKLPKIGEGENGTVFDYEGCATAVFKVAKPRPYSRDHVLGEAEQTAVFEREGIPVPRILEVDRFGRYVVKERLAGVSLAIVYDLLGDPTGARHRLVRGSVHRFVDTLLDLFVRHPESKISISPNNIFVLEWGDRCDCLLVDTGLAPSHDYSAFDFDEYWNVTVPQKIRKYRAVGYVEAAHAESAAV